MTTQSVGEPVAVLRIDRGSTVVERLGAMVPVPGRAAGATGMAASGSRQRREPHSARQARGESPDALAARAGSNRRGCASGLTSFRLARRMPRIGYRSPSPRDVWAFSCGSVRARSRRS